MPVTGCKVQHRPRNHAAAMLGAVTGAWLTLSGFAPSGIAATPDPDQQRWLAPHESGLVTDGQVHFFPLPHERSGPTTVVVAADGRIWFTEGTGNRIGSMNPDGTGLLEFPLPHPDSAPRILARGSDGNLWFSEHTGNRVARITQDGTSLNGIFPRRTVSRVPLRWARTAISGLACSPLARSAASPQGRDQRIHPADSRQRSARTRRGR